MGGGSLTATSKDAESKVARDNSGVMWLPTGSSQLTVGSGREFATNVAYDSFRSKRAQILGGDIASAYPFGENRNAATTILF